MITLSGLMILLFLGILLRWKKVKYIFRPLSKSETIYGLILGASIEIVHILLNPETQRDFFSYINQYASRSIFFWLSHFIIALLIIKNAEISNEKYQNGMHIILWSIIGIGISNTFLLTKITLYQLNHIDGEAPAAMFAFLYPPIDFIVLILSGYQYLLVNSGLSILIIGGYTIVKHYRNK